MTPRAEGATIHWLPLPHTSGALTPTAVRAALWHSDAARRGRDVGGRHRIATEVRRPEVGSVEDNAHRVFACPVGGEHRAVGRPHAHHRVVATVGDEQIRPVVDDARRIITDAVSAEGDAVARSDDGAVATLR